MFKPQSPDRTATVPNGITLLRLGLSLTFFVLAILRGRELYNFIGLGIHWLGDVLDGFWARRFKQETILGAEIDIIADRVEILFFYVIFLTFHPQLFLPVVIYAIDFAFVDFYLSYQFVKYDIISPNYFFKVDPLVYRLNYSPGGKFVNSTVVTLLLIFLPQVWGLTAGLAAGLVALKTFSIRRLHKIGDPDKKNPLGPGGKENQT